jgi:hypothetical protein
MSLINAHAFFYIHLPASIWKIQTGWISWAFFALLTLSTLHDFKENHPNIFNIVHMSFIGAYVFAFYHSGPSSIYIYSISALYGLELAYRSIRGIWPQKTLEIESMSLNGLRIKLSKRWHIQYSYGQSVLLNFPLINPLKWEKFYISSGPHEENVQVVIPPNHNMESLHHKILECLPSSKTQWVRVDGPYESWPLNFFRYNNVILMAENHGIFPCMSLLRHVYRINQDDESDGTDECLIQTIFLVWICKNYAEYKWNAIEFEKAMERSKSDSFPTLYVSFTFKNIVPFSISIGICTYLKSWT